MQACGSLWRIHRMDVEVLERFTDWIRPQMPDSFAGLDKILPHLSREDALKAIEDAKARQVVDYGSPFMQEMLGTTRGQLHLFLFMLQFHQPDCKLADAYDVMRELGAARMTEIFEATRGEFAQGKQQAPAAAGNGELTGAMSAGA